MSFRNAESENSFIEPWRKKDKGHWPHELTVRVRGEIDVEKNLTIIKNGLCLVASACSNNPSYLQYVSKRCKPIGNNFFLNIFY